MKNNYRLVDIYRCFAVFVLAMLFIACGDIREVPDAKCRFPGKQDCACLENNRCYQSAAGLQMLCQEGVCVEPVCGSESDLQKGCLCGDGALCEGDLICINGNCIEDTGQTREAPTNPICYTPCRGGGLTMADGSFATCDSDGLMQGCLNGSACVDGTCKAPAPIMAGQPVSQNPSQPASCVRL